jgi:hypothetical protein
MAAKDQKNQSSAHTDDESIETKTTSLNMATDDLKHLMEELRAKYPAWKPVNIGDILSGKIESVKDFPFMHQGKGSIMAVIATGLPAGDENEFVALWLNTVAQSQLLKIRNARGDAGEEVTMEADHDTRSAAIKELEGAEIIIQYDGEKKSDDKKKSNLNPYQKFIIVENVTKASKKAGK